MENETCPGLNSLDKASINPSKHPALIPRTPIVFITENWRRSIRAENPPEAINNMERKKRFINFSAG